MPPKAAYYLLSGCVHALHPPSVPRLRLMLVIADVGVDAVLLGVGR